MKLFFKALCIFIFLTTGLLGCYNSSATFCRNLSEEYGELLYQDENIELRSWENLYIHHEFLVKPLLENWERSYFEKEQFFSLTFYALLRSQSTLECGVEPKENTASSEKRMQADSIGLTKIETESHPYFGCLFSEWKKHAKPLIFKSCKYYFTH